MLQIYGARNPRVLPSEMIANHFSHRLSELDLLMASYVPPGGNWKNIPLHVPSNRLAQIRESYAAGEGSRSTYYGRLKSDQPSYTINTYFNRPGNGCFLHYDFDGGQHRTISQREAARLQSFPDSFEFMGSKASINKQIGNAVPPLLAYQIAKTFLQAGSFVDLFSGAGGLSLGFHWANWKQIVANDIEKSFLDTYQKNLGGDVVIGDIASPQVFDELVDRAKVSRRSGPFIVVGGPPCQGFSTAGNRRSNEDQRNHLFKQYAKFLSCVGADGFVFENVPGLLSMEQGQFFSTVCRTLEDCNYRLSIWILRAQDFGVPQKRTRVFVVGQRDKILRAAPLAITAGEAAGASQLPLGRQTWSAHQVLDDLPAISAGQDGALLSYDHTSKNDYQKFMRSQISVQSLIETLSEPVAA